MLQGNKPRWSSVLVHNAHTPEGIEDAGAMCQHEVDYLQQPLCSSPIPGSCLPQVRLEIHAGCLILCICSGEPTITQLSRWLHRLLCMATPPASKSKLLPCRFSVPHLVRCILGSTLRCMVLGSLFNLGLSMTGNAKGFWAAKVSSCSKPSS